MFFGKNPDEISLLETSKVKFETVEECLEDRKKYWQRAAEKGYDTIDCARIVALCVEGRPTAKFDNKCYWIKTKKSKNRHHEVIKCITQVAP